MRVSRKPAAEGGNLKEPWAKGRSGNPRGRPRGKGPTWAGLIRRIGDMTVEEVVDEIERIVRSWKKYPDRGTLRELAIIRAYALLMNHTDSGLLRELMERSDGKVKEARKLEHTPAILGYQERVERVYGQGALVLQSATPKRGRKGCKQG